MIGLLTMRYISQHRIWTFHISLSSSLASNVCYGNASVQTLHCSFFLINISSAALGFTTWFRPQSRVIPLTFAYQCPPKSDFGPIYLSFSYQRLKANVQTPLWHCSHDSSIHHGFCATSLSSWTSSADATPQRITLHRNASRTIVELRSRKTRLLAKETEILGRRLLPARRFSAWWHCISTWRMRLEHHCWVLEPWLAGRHVLSSWWNLGHSSDQSIDREAQHRRLRQVFGWMDRWPKTSSRPRVRSVSWVRTRSQRETKSIE